MSFQSAEFNTEQFAVPTRQLFEAHLSYLTGDDPPTALQTRKHAEQIIDRAGNTAITEGERLHLIAALHTILDNCFFDSDNDKIREALSKYDLALVIGPQDDASTAQFNNEHRNQLLLSPNQTTIVFAPEVISWCIKNMSDVRVVQRNDLLQDQIVIDADFFIPEHPNRRIKLAFPGDAGLITADGQRCGYRYLELSTFLSELALLSAQAKEDGTPFYLLDIGVSKGTFLTDLKRLFPHITTIGTTVNLSPSIKFGVDHTAIALGSALPLPREQMHYVVCGVRTTGYFIYDDLAMLEMVKTLRVGGKLDVELGYGFRVPRVPFRDMIYETQELGYGEVFVTPDQVALRVSVMHRLLDDLAARGVIRIERREMNEQYILRSPIRKSEDEGFIINGGRLTLIKTASILDVLGEIEDLRLSLSAKPV